MSPAIRKERSAWSSSSTIIAVTAASLPDVLKLIGSDKDVRLVVKEFPILGPGSVIAAKAAIAARHQNKYWNFHLALMRMPGTVEAAKVFEVAKSVGLDVQSSRATWTNRRWRRSWLRIHAMAQALGIQGTPAFIIDQTLIPGALGYDGLTSAVAAVKDAGGCKSC